MYADSNRPVSYAGDIVVLAGLPSANVIIIGFRLYHCGPEIELILFFQSSESKQNKAVYLLIIQQFAERHAYSLSWGARGLDIFQPQPYVRRSATNMCLDSSITGKRLEEWTLSLCSCFIIICQTAYGWDPPTPPPPTPRRHLRRLHRMSL